MREGMLHIRDVEDPKKTGSVETRLEAMEQQEVFKCHGLVERGLNANHVMITEFTSKHRIDANDIGKHLSRIYDRMDQLQAQIYDLQNQNYVEAGEAVVAAKARAEEGHRRMLGRHRGVEVVVRMERRRLGKKRGIDTRQERLGHRRGDGGTKRWCGSPEKMGSMAAPSN
ncbi:40S ribosomal protein S5-1 [Hordeum vulgare]|nr:40S ribosomal protein S5-1 [Hordeum vulgare]